MLGFVALVIAQVTRNSDPSVEARRGSSTTTIASVPPVHIRSGNLTAIVPQLSSPEGTVRNASTHAAAAPPGHEGKCIAAACAAAKSTATARDRRSKKSPLVRFDRALRRTYLRMVRLLSVSSHVLTATARDVRTSSVTALLLARYCAAWALAFAHDIGNRAWHMVLAAHALGAGAIASARAALTGPRALRWVGNVRDATRLTWEMAKAGSSRAKRGLRNSKSAARWVGRLVHGTNVKRPQEVRPGRGESPEAQRRALQRSHISRILALDEEDYFGVLEVSPKATPQQVKVAFRNLARLLHPDKCSEKHAHAAFLRMQAAQTILTDPEQRANLRAGWRHSGYAKQQYDFGLHARSSRQPPRTRQRDR